MHVTFLMLLAYVAWRGWTEVPEARWLGLSWSVTSVLLLFTCVVMHELGHAFMARRFGIAVPRILLLPIGGMAEFSSIPREPGREIAIALAGPAVNFFLVLVLAALVPIPTLAQLAELEFSFTNFAQHLLVMNLLMGVFNLIPVFPMDGGRVLRAWLVRRCSYQRATFWAAMVAKVLATAGFIAAVAWLQMPLLALLFAFIFWAGEVEYRSVKRQEEIEAHWRAFYARVGGGQAADTAATAGKRLDE